MGLPVGIGVIAQYGRSPQRCLISGIPSAWCPRGRLLECEVPGEFIEGFLDESGFGVHSESLHRGGMRSGR